MGGSINLHISCIISACSKVIVLYSLRLVITRRLGNSTIRLRLLLRMISNVWILTSNRGLMTLHGRIPFLTTLSTDNRWWWSITLESLVVCGNRRRGRVVVMTLCWVVLVVSGNVYCFVGLDIGGGGYNVECVNHRWDLDISHCWSVREVAYPDDDP
jgi:hypothetical protein